MGVRVNPGAAGCWINTSRILPSAPITVGCWMWTDAGSASAAWSQTNSGSATDYQRLGMTGGGIPALTIRTSTSAAININCGVTADSSAWLFGIARFATTSSRFIDGIGSDGSVGGNTDTTLLVPSLNRMTIGRKDAGLEEFLGYIAEYWICDGDIGPTSTTALSTSFIQQLAYRGPLSVTSVKDSLIEYASFRSAGFPAGGGGTRLNEFYCNGSPLPWVLNGIPPLISEHPYGATNYVGPNDFISVNPMNSVV